jgi:hypothetical protein
MSEASAVPARGRQDIVTLEDGLTIRVVLIFKAPSWEDARKVYAWAMEHLKRRVIPTPLSWVRVQALVRFAENPNTKKTVPYLRAAPKVKRSQTKLRSSQTKLRSSQTKLRSVKSEGPPKKS